MRNRIAAAAVLIAAVTAGVVGPVHADDTPPDDQLEQRVGSNEEIITDEPVEIDHGHLDMGPRLVQGHWELLLRDDSQSPAVWRDPDDVVIRVRDEAKLPAPSGQKYEFLGLDDGSEVYVVPQVQNPAVVWIGWNTQDPAVVKELQRGANLTLTGFSGPGTLSLFLQDGAFGDPLPMWDSTNPEPQDVWMETNTHVHANWVFSQPGVYVAQVKVQGTTIAQQDRSATAHLRFAVGNAVGVDDVRAAATLEVNPSTPSVAPGTGGEPNPERFVLAPEMVGIAILAGIVVFAGIVTFAASRRSRNLRRQALRTTGREPQP